MIREWVADGLFMVAAVVALVIFCWLAT